MRVGCEGSGLRAHPRRLKNRDGGALPLVVPAKAGTHSHRSGIWTPAFAGATQDNKGPPCSASSCSASSPSPRPPSRSARRRHRRPPTRRAIPRSRCYRPAPPSWARSCAIRSAIRMSRPRSSRSRPANAPSRTSMPCRYSPISWRANSPSITEQGACASTSRAKASWRRWMWPISDSMPSANGTPDVEPMK